MAKPIYALVGADSFLQTEKLAEILGQFGQDIHRADFDGPSAELADVLDELRSFAMFGGSKVVVVRDADEFVSKYREMLEEALGHPPDSGTLVLRLSSLPKTTRISKIIGKVGEVIECAPPRDLMRWAIDRAKTQHKLTLAPDAARILVDMIGDDLGRLDQELAKLAVCSTSGKVSADDVQCNVAFQREREMWDLTNALAVGDTDEAMRRWRQLLQLDPSAELRAVTWLAMWLEDVGRVLAGDRNSPEAKKMFWKYKGDAYGQFVKNANALGREGYARAVDLLAEIDRQSKTGVGDAAENVERFILTLASGVST